METVTFVPDDKVDTLDCFGWRRPARTSTGQHKVLFVQPSRMDVLPSYIIEDARIDRVVHEGSWIECIEWLERQYGTTLVVRNFHIEGSRRQFGFIMPDVLKRRVKEHCRDSGVTMTEWICATLDMALRWETGKLELATGSAEQYPPNVDPSVYHGGEHVIAPADDEEDYHWGQIRAVLDGGIRGKLQEFFFEHAVFPTRVFMETNLNQYAQVRSIKIGKVRELAMARLEEMGFVRGRGSYEGKSTMLWTANPKHYKDQNDRFLMWTFRQGYEPFDIFDVAAIFDTSRKEDMDGLRESFNSNSRYVNLGKDRWKRSERPVTATREHNPKDFDVARDVFSLPPDPPKEDSPSPTDPDPKPEASPFLGFTDGNGEAEGPPPTPNDNPFPVDA